MTRAARVGAVVVPGALGDDGMPGEAEVAGEGKGHLNNAPRAERGARADAEVVREDMSREALTAARALAAGADPVKVGTVSVSATRAPESELRKKYGRELPYAEGTRLDAKKQPVEGLEEVAYVVGRVLDVDGWLVQRAIPIGETGLSQ